MTRGDVAVHFYLRFGVTIFFSHRRATNQSRRSAGHEDPFVAPPARGPAEPKGASACEVGRAPLMRFSFYPFSTSRPRRDFPFSRRRPRLRDHPASTFARSRARAFRRPLRWSSSSLRFSRARRLRDCFTLLSSRRFSLERQARRCCSMWGTTCSTSDRFRPAAQCGATANRLVKRLVVYDPSCGRHRRTRSVTHTSDSFHVERRRFT